MATVNKSTQSKDNKNKVTGKAIQNVDTLHSNKNRNQQEQDQLKQSTSKTLKQSEADKNVYSLSSNYAQILLKYKSLAGKQKSINLPRSPKKGKAITETSNSQDQVQYQSSPKKNSHKNIQKPVIQEYPQNTESGEKSVEAYKTFRNGNKTYIKFLAEKQHEPNALGRIENHNQKLQSSLEAKHVLNSTRRILSLPVIIKPTSSPIKMKKGLLKEKEVKESSPESIAQKSRAKIDRIQKERSLNSVAFLLTNIREKISEGGIKNQYRSYKPQSSSKNNQQAHTFLSEISPRKTVKSKASLLEFSNSPTAIVNSQSAKKNVSPPIQNKKQDSPPPIQSQKQSENVPNQIDNNSIISLEIKKTSKQKQMNAKLEQIKEDIENENNEKEQLLKQNRTINKNLQISVLEKRRKITQLQSELAQYQSLQNNQNSLNQNFQGQKVQLAELYQVKAAKEKLFKEQKNKLKDEISQIQKKILEQETKFNNLRETEIEIRGEEIAEKQKQMQLKNKQMSEELLKKRKQLQQAIEKEKEKSRIYKLELEDQSKKNAEIAMQLKKQEQLEQLLIEQIEKMVKQRRKKAQRKEEEKKKERDRLIDEIKQLEETQNRLLMEYQRDSQSASNIFEAMRLKNQELEQKIKRKKEGQQITQFS